MEFLEPLAPLLKIFWYVAIPVSIIFFIQSIMTFLGMESSDGLHADFDSNLDGLDGHFHVFSFRNLINFLLGLSWTGISLYSVIENKTILLAVSILAGVGFVALFFVIMQQIQRLAEDNSFKIINTLHKTGTVYLTIPANKSGLGKVQISVNGSFREIDAITANEKIDTGAAVRVVAIESNNLIVVEKV